MAFPTDVNDQITDAVTQTNTKVLGESPAESMGEDLEEMAPEDYRAESTPVVVEEELGEGLDEFKVATEQAIENTIHTVESGEGNSGLSSQAATTQGISTLYDVDTASPGKATKDIFE